MECKECDTIFPDDTKSCMERGMPQYIAGNTQDLQSADLVVGAQKDENDEDNKGHLKEVSKKTDWFRFRVWELIVLVLLLGGTCYLSWMTEKNRSEDEMKKIQMQIQQSEKVELPDGDSLSALPSVPRLSMWAETMLMEEV